jgi:glycosyltransferase involved in cell wall biosynthesis
MKGFREKMSDTPLVSIITATYNMADYVADTIDSLLAQTHPAVECIVVDDGSTDHTPDVLARYADDARVKIVRQENAGQTVAKNHGLREASGELIGFCDADDLWRPDKLALQLPHFRDETVGVVYGNFQFIDGEGRPIATDRPATYSGRITGKLLVDNFVHFPTALVRREIIDAAGGFDESLSMGIDFDLWLRISVDYDFLYLPDILVDYRIWAGQMSHRTGERLDNAFKLMHRFLADHPNSVTKADRRRAWSHTYVSRGLWRKRQGERSGAVADFGRAFLQRPWDRRLWASAAKILLGRPL